MRIVEGEVSGVALNQIALPNQGKVLQDSRGVGLELRSGIRQDHKENAREFHPDTSGQSVGKLFGVVMLRHFFRQVNRDSIE
jgi:hypothetical protein